MGALGNIVKKGVRLIVTDADRSAAETATALSTPKEISAEALAVDQESASPGSALPAASDFAEIYREAGIELAPHGYGIDKVAEMLENKRLATLTREVRATAVLTALEAAGVALKDVIQDAVRRDQALDAFEAAKRQELEALKTDNQGRVAAVQDAIESFLREKNAEIQAMKKATDAAIQAFAELTTRKQKEEERLRDIVTFFVEPADNPITTAAPAGKTPPAKTEQA
jgi:hypothetical protein